MPKLSRITFPNIANKSYTQQTNQNGEKIEEKNEREIVDRKYVMFDFMTEYFAIDAKLIRTLTKRKKKKNQ